MATKKVSRRPKKSAQPGPIKLQLNGIRLAESMCKLGDLKSDLPKQANQAVSAALFKKNDDDTYVINLRVKLDFTYEGDKEPAITVAASFLAHYTLVEGIDDQEAFKKFMQHAGLLHMWPYWREFAQSIIARMGLPQFTVPLFNMGDLAKEPIEAEKNHNDD